MRNSGDKVDQRLLVDMGRGRRGTPRLATNVSDGKAVETVPSSRRRLSMKPEC